MHWDISFGSHHGTKPHPATAFRPTSAFVAPRDSQKHRHPYLRHRGRSLLRPRFSPDDPDLMTHLREWTNVRTPASLIFNL